MIFGGPEAPKPNSILQLNEAAEAPNRILRVLLESALNTNSDIPPHGVNLLNALTDNASVDVI